MNTDIRIKTSFPNHPKTMKLIDLMGETAPWKLIKLWLFAGQNKPDGILSNMSKQAICTVMGHKGNPTLMINALKKCGFLEKHESGFWALHDWKFHNPYAFHSEARIARAKKGAAARWESKSKQILPGCYKHDEAMPQADSSNAPAPSPVPVPSPEERGKHSPQAEKVSHQKAEKAWSSFEPIVKNAKLEDRIVIPDPISQKVFFDLGGLSKIQELIAQNGSALKSVFCAKYAALEVQTYAAGR